MQQELETKEQRQQLILMRKVHIEKSDKFAEVELGGETIVRILKSIDMNVTTELDGSLVVYGNTPIIIVLCKASVKPEKF